MIQLNDFYSTVIENHRDYEFTKEGNYSIIKKGFLTTEYSYYSDGKKITIQNFGFQYISSYQYYSTEERDRDFKEIFNKKYNYLLK